MNVGEANPKSYYFECAWHNSWLDEGADDRAEKFGSAIARCFDGYQVVESGGQNGFGFAYITIELCNGPDFNVSVDMLIDKCYVLASYMNTSVEQLSIQRWVKSL
jgi:hypothetical protein